MGARLLWVLSASALLIAALAPTALAQAEIGGNVQYVDCSQVQNVVVNQGQYANASGEGAVASAAQELNITQNQVNACLGGVNNGGGANGEPTGQPTNGETTDGGEETTVVAGKTVILVDGDVAADTLPKTGGASFPGILLASGCALLGAGLLLNRIAR